MYKLRKSERLYNYKLKELLFKKGNAFTVYPFKIYWHILSPGPHCFCKTPVIKAAAEINHHKTTKNHYDLSGHVMPPGAIFQFPGKTIFSVSKKNIKKAVARNRIKRLIKEAYRKNKTPFYAFLDKKELKCLTAFLYIGNQSPTQDEIEKKVIVSLHSLINDIEKNILKNRLRE